MRDVSKKALSRLWPNLPIAGEKLTPQRHALIWVCCGLQGG